MERKYVNIAYMVFCIFLQLTDKIPSFHYIVNRTRIKQACDSKLDMTLKLKRRKHSP